MKKNICIVFALAALLLSSCGKEYVRRDNRVYAPDEIAFSAVGYTMGTKTDNIVDFPTDRTLGVFAWKSSEVWASAASLTTFIDNVEAEFDPEDELWKPVTVYKWPASGYTHFLCYSPYSATPLINWNATDGLTASSFTVPAAADVDFCYSDFTTDAQQLMSPAECAYILMRHALTKVSFTVAPISVPESMVSTVDSIKVTDLSVELSGIKNVASFAAGAWTSDGWASPAWDGQSGDASYTYTEGALLLLPQALEEGVQKLDVSFNVSVYFKSKPGEPYVYALSDSRDFLCDACGEWGINKHIRYNLHFNVFDDEITFTPYYVDWVDQSGTILFGGTTHGTLENPSVEDANYLFQDLPHGGPENISVIDANNLFGEN